MPWRVLTEGGGMGTRAKEVGDVTELLSTGAQLKENNRLLRLLRGQKLRLRQARADLNVRQIHQNSQTSRITWGVYLKGNVSCYPTYLHARKALCLCWRNSWPGLSWTSGATLHRTKTGAINSVYTGKKKLVNEQYFYASLIP